MIVVEQSTLKVSHFYPKKNEMVEPTYEMLHKWKPNGNAVKYLRMDNAGENKSLQQRAASNDWKLNLTCEFTARIAANVPLLNRFLLYLKAFEYVMDTDGLRVLTRDGKLRTRYAHFGLQIPPFAQHLQTWGEADTVTVKVKATPKLADRGIQSMFVGYAKDHPGDTYHMWNPLTGRILVTLDIVWLRRMFYAPAPTTLPHIGDDAVTITIPITAPACGAC
jgi:hypothetical protein